MTAISVNDLFDIAAIEMQGPVPWRTPVSETRSGVYVISLTNPSAVSLDRLGELDRPRWIAGQSVVYIGRATSLTKRLGQFYRHQYGRKAPHRGGQAILLLDGDLQVHWGCVEDFAAAEDRMIESFRARVDALPFANRMHSAKVTGRTTTVTRARDEG